MQNYEFIGYLFPGVMEGVLKFFTSLPELQDGGMGGGAGPTTEGHS